MFKPIRIGAPGARGPADPPRTSQPIPGRLSRLATSVAHGFESLMNGGAPRRPGAGARPLTAHAEFDAWVRTGASDEDRSEARFRLKSYGPQLIELTSLGARSMPPRLGELFPRATQLLFGSNRLSGALDLGALELPGQLRQLDLRDNHITDVSGLRGFTKLDSLFLQSNRLNTVTELSELPMLKTLYLYDNNFGAPPEVARCPELVTLLLSGNGMRALPDLRGLEKLMDVDLSGNDLRTVPPWFAHLPRTTRVDLRGNPLANLRGLGEGQILSSPPAPGDAVGASTQERGRTASRL